MQVGEGLAAAEKHDSISDTRTTYSSPLSLVAVLSEPSPLLRVTVVDPEIAEANR
jgi:hypothetical protein